MKKYKVNVYYDMKYRNVHIEISLHVYHDILIKKLYVDERLFYTKVTHEDGHHLIVHVKKCWMTNWVKYPFYTTLNDDIKGTGSVPLKIKVEIIIVIKFYNKELLQLVVTLVMVFIIYDRYQLDVILRCRVRERCVWTKLR